MYRDNQTVMSTAGLKSTGTTVVIGDPHPAYAAALAGIYASAHPGVSIFTTTCFNELASQAAANPGAIVLVNPKMDNAPGLSTTVTLRETCDISRLVVLIDQDNAGLGAYFMTRGAQAAVSKSAEFTALQDILLRGAQDVSLDKANDDEPETFTLDFYEGLANLTKRQATILNYLKQGKLNKQIAHELGISEATVKHHVSALLSALGFYSRSQLVAMINELGINVDYRPRSRARSNLRNLQDYRGKPGMVNGNAVNTVAPSTLAAVHA
ncbi:response regulator transcription factor [Pseudovibrio sp. SPO723]|uniref:response regulator transcription factor n=1 Tax=Nesiotobacter zosterae TaxID=392721 RepID=UPI0029C1C860|nr:response regulator transcription factor [Pseudovibrio sp. SPO723]MDX5593247.1 response regulator transcription factor [Pseudovibrio sp. SPO723]